MAGKDGDLGSRVVTGIAAFVAAFAARKLITLVWRRAVGKEPPENPENPEVALAEALGWAVVTGVGTGAARLLATRATARRLRPARRDLRPAHRDEPR